MDNRLLLKEKLRAFLEEIQPHQDGSPFTNLQIKETTAAEIEQLTIQVESCNPNPQPLVNAISLLNGSWQLQYSTAREIRSLVSLPLGLKLGKVFQVIDVSNWSLDYRTAGAMSKLQKGKRRRKKNLTML